MSFANRGERNLAAARGFRFGLGYWVATSKDASRLNGPLSGTEPMAACGAQATTAVVSDTA